MTGWLSAKHLLIPDQWDALKRQARALRSQGRSYEDIAEELSDDHMSFRPYEVYAWVNPAKSFDQVRAWRDRHDP